MSADAVGEFERVVLPYLDEAYTLARYLLRDEHDAQDVVQEAALRALRHLAGYRGGDARAWWLAIVRHCAFDWHRRHRGIRRPHSLDEQAEAVLAGDQAADRRAMRHSEGARVARAIAELPAEFREVIVLREVQELSYKEISTVIAAPIGTVMSRLARARARLAELLGDRSQEAS